MQLVSIGTYKTEVQAQLVKSRLMFEGIMSHLSPLSLKSSNSGRFELFVIEQDKEDALTVLKLFKEEPPELVG
jgi:cell division protein FtsN